MSRLHEILCALSLALPGCGSGVSRVTVDAEDPSTIGGGAESGDFILGVGSGVLDLGPGESTAVEVKLIRGDGLDDTVSLSVWNGNAGISAYLEDERLDGDTTSLQVAVEADLEPGTYPLTVVAQHGSIVRTARLDVRIPGDAGFTLMAPPHVALRQGSHCTVPITIKYAPRAKGPTELDLGGLPAGVSGTFATWSLDVAQTRLTLSAGPSVEPGTYPVDVRGTLEGRTYIARMQVTVASDSDLPDAYIAGVDFGQTIVRDEMTLVRGKSALLRVHVVADRVVSSPTVSVTASAHGEVLGEMTMLAPAFVSESVNLDDLSASYTTTLPADWVVDGLHLRVLLDPEDLAADRDRLNNQWQRDVAVDRGARLSLTLVPIRIGPHTGTVNDFTPTVLAMLPLRDVTISVRPTYKPSSVKGSTIDADEWYGLLSELRSLHKIDGDKGHLYGLVPTASNDSGIGGLGYLGYPVAAGLDQFGSLLVHELGHNFDLQHVPCGTTGDPDYPYSPSTIGTRGYSTLSNNLVPTWFRDVMSYCSPVWISDYSYEKAQSWVQADVFATRIEGDPGPVLSVSGTIRDGRVTLDPLLPTTGIPTVQGGDHALTITTSEGSYTHSFEPLFVSKCSARDARDHGHFQILIPDRGDVQTLTIERDGRLLYFEQRVFEARIGPSDPSVDLDELENELSVKWDDSRYPTITVAHVGERTTTLGLWLRGGSVKLDLDGVPTGGVFRLILSSGFDNEVVELPR